MTTISHPPGGFFTYASAALGRAAIVLILVVVAAGLLNANWPPAPYFRFSRVRRRVASLAASAASSV